MRTKYLLPCPCGQHTAIEPRQAGEAIRCSCGATLQAPTWLEIAALEPVPELPPEAAPSSWGGPQRLVLLGVVLAVAGALFAVWRYANRPVSRFDLVDAEELRQTAKTLPPHVAWENWEIMKQGLDRRSDEAHADALLRYRIWMGVLAAMVLLGFGLAGAGLAVAKRDRATPLRIF